MSTVSRPVWAVCLYVIGGEDDGTNTIRFPLAADSAEAEANAVDLARRDSPDADDFDVLAAQVVLAGGEA